MLLTKFLIILGFRGQVPNSRLSAWTTTGGPRCPPPNAPGLRPYRHPGATSVPGISRSPHGFQPRMWSTNQSNLRLQSCGNVSAESDSMKENRTGLARPSPVHSYGQRHAVTSCGQIRMDHPSNEQFQRHPRPTGQRARRPSNVGGNHIQNRPNMRPNLISLGKIPIPGNRHNTGPITLSNVQQNSAICTDTILRKPHALQTNVVGSQSQQNSFVRTQNKFTFRRPVEAAAAADLKVINLRAPVDSRVRQEEQSVNTEETVDLWEDGKDTLRKTMTKQMSKEIRK